MKSKTSSGHDNINSKLLKAVESCIVKPISTLINKSIETGIVPDIMKLAKVIPIYKAKNKDDFSNYRPIFQGVLSVLSIQRGSLTRHVLRFPVFRHVFIPVCIFVLPITLFFMSTNLDLVLKIVDVSAQPMLYILFLLFIYINLVLQNFVLFYFWNNLNSQRVIYKRIVESTGLHAQIVKCSPVSTCVFSFVLWHQVDYSLPYPWVPRRGFPNGIFPRQTQVINSVSRTLDNGDDHIPAVMK